MNLNGFLISSNVGISQQILLNYQQLEPIRFEAQELHNYHFHHASHLELKLKGNFEAFWNGNTRESFPNDENVEYSLWPFTFIYNCPLGRVGQFGLELEWLTCQNALLFKLELPSHLKFK